MPPTRISIVTYNIWGTQRWPARAPALERFLNLFTPDILCLQELKPTTQAFIDRVLNTHDRIGDSLAGWANEGNIYWNRALFERVEHGAEDIGQLEPERRLFWARLQLRSTSKTIFVSTAHLSTARHHDEEETGVSPRVAQLKRVNEELTRHVRGHEPAFFMGDMNDGWHPQMILKRIGFVSCFAALGLQSPPTYQCYPTANIEPDAHSITSAIDILVANRHARPIAACVPQVFAGDLAPSDHWPVQAIYQIDSVASS